MQSRTLQLALCFIFSAAGRLHAQPAAGLEIKVCGLQNYQSLLPADDQLPAADSNSHLQLVFRLPGAGRVRVLYVRRRRHESVPQFAGADGLVFDPLHVTLLKGTAHFRNQQTWASGSIYRSGNVARLYVNFSRVTGRRGRLRLYTIDVPLQFSGRCASGRLERGSEEKLRTLGCASALVQAAKAEKTADSNPRSKASSVKPLRVVDIALYGDSAWYRLHRDQSNALISSILNKVETIYEAQLGLTFAVKQQVVLKDYNFEGSSALKKLSSLAQSARARSIPGYPAADVYHLFTGQQLEGSIVGIAYQINDNYLGVVCRHPEYSFSVSQFLSKTLSPFTLGHEIGHLLGASHPEEDPRVLAEHPPPSLMSGTLPASKEGNRLRFLDFSVRQIGRYVDAFGFCLNEKSHFQAALNEAGLLSARIDSGRNLTGCKAILRGAFQRRRLNRGLVLAEDRSTSSTIQFQTSIPRRVHCGSNR
jgi:hypothetical protein